MNTNSDNLSLFLKCFKVKVLPSLEAVAASVNWAVPRSPDVTDVWIGPQCVAPSRWLSTIHPPLLSRGCCNQCWFATPASLKQFGWGENNTEGCRLLQPIYDTHYVFQLPSWQWRRRDGFPFHSIRNIKQRALLFFFLISLTCWV